MRDGLCLLNAASWQWGGSESFPSPQLWSLLSNEPDMLAVVKAVRIGSDLI